MSTRAERLLSAPIVPTLARLSAPGVLLVAFQSMVSVSDTYFVGRLGTAPLAGLALVFPLIMLLQMTSAGAMGGGVSSAIARALGAGDQAGARRLVAHALVIAAAMGVGFTVLVLLLGPLLYRLLGGEGESLRNALAYSNIIFGGAITVWIANTLSSVLRRLSPSPPSRRYSSGPKRRTRTVKPTPMAAAMTSACATSLRAPA